MLLTVLVVLTVQQMVPGTETSKVKRVVEGVPVNDRDMGYSAVRYFTWLSNGHECDVPVPGFLKSLFGLRADSSLPFSVYGFQCAPIADNLLCGGALITPYIVQTACHCVASFPKSQVPPERYFAKLKSTWEMFTRVYVGANTVDLLKVGVPAKAFLIHQQCAQIQRFPYPFTHDFGWITLQFSVLEYADFRYAPIDFAPSYDLRSMTETWTHRQNAGLMCLYIGFGAYQVGPALDASWVLRHGWGRSVNYWTCYIFTGRESYPPWDPAKYKRDATWMCSRPFPQHRECPSRGDSGGPVTCDNLYSALLSQRNQVLMQDDLYGETKLELRVLSSALVFAIFENAAEYRSAFVDAIKDYDGYRAQFGLPTFGPLDNYIQP